MNQENVDSKDKSVDQTKQAKAQTKESIECTHRRIPYEHITYDSKHLQKVGKAVWVFYSKAINDLKHRYTPFSHHIANHTANVRRDQLKYWSNDCIQRQTAQLLLYSVHLIS